MSLTFPGGPLAAGSGAPGDVNYAIDGPMHRLLMHPFPRRVRATLGGETVLDTTRGVLLHESNILPRFYLPLADVQGELLERTDHSTHCPFKGDASYWTVRAGDRVAENAVWTYEAPIDTARWLQGLVSVYHEAMDAWFDEDEELPGHLRDPYHRVDARRSSRVVEVRAGDTVVARSERPVVVGETGPAAAPLHPARGRARRAAPERDDHGVPVQGRRVVLVTRRRRGRGLVLRAAAGGDGEGRRPRRVRRGQGGDPGSRLELEDVALAGDVDGPAERALGLAARPAARRARRRCA